MNENPLDIGDAGPKAKESVVTVGDGRGFVVKGPMDQLLVVTV